MDLAKPDGDCHVAVAPRNDGQDEASLRVKRSHLMDLAYLTEIATSLSLLAMTDRMRRHCE